MEIYKNKYWTISFEKEYSLFFPIWNKASEDLTEEEYKHELTQYTEQVELYHPNRLLLDARNLSFGITIELQEWLDESILPRIFQAGLRNVAIILPTHLISQLSVEQAMEEKNGLQYNTKYFDNVEQARTWLLSLPIEYT